MPKDTPLGRKYSQYTPNNIPIRNAFGIYRKIFTDDELEEAGYVFVKDDDGRITMITPQQDAFCRYYALNPENPTKAAYLAGFGKKYRSHTDRVAVAERTQKKLRTRRDIKKRCKDLLALIRIGIDVEPK